MMLTQHGVGARSCRFGSVDGLDAARVLLLSNQPFPQDSARTKGDPAGLRYSALGAVHWTLANGKECAKSYRVARSFNRSTVRAQPGPSNVI